MNIEWQLIVDPPRERYALGWDRPVTWLDLILATVFLVGLVVLLMHVSG